MTNAQPVKRFLNLRKISPHLQEMDQIPLFGNSPEFDWARFSSLAASRFGISKLSIQPGNQEWRGAEDLRKGMGNNVQVFPIDLSPLAGSVYWMMSRADIAKFTSWMLNGKSKARALASEILQEGFYRYLLLEMMDAAQGIELLQGFTPILHEEAALPEESSFCIDVQISFDHSGCSGRLVIPSRFRQSWVHHFNSFPSDQIPARLSRGLELILGVKTGSVLLHQSEWEKIKKGDFIVLDRGSFDAKKSAGAAFLMLGTTPLFNVKIKQNKIQLLDYSFIYEDATDMEKKMPGESEDVFSGPAQSMRPAEEGEAVALRDLPIHVSVELARMRVTLEQLMQMAPGNLLELPIQPEQPVALTVNGQKVGAAELVYLGETLGIRILELG
ncbi:MAG: type III secretion system cytoplasmic ring protein SctQ [Verrucomicrobia bacterium]|nr:type III secretion system cytoplasmic ring protein SctQ [Verrucomicrobiota bacterium]